jgi:hypothetical protein
MGLCRFGLIDVLEPFKKLGRLATELSVACSLDSIMGSCRVPDRMECTSIRNTAKIGM